MTKHLKVMFGGTNAKTINTHEEPNFDEDSCASILL